MKWVAFPGSIGALALCLRVTPVFAEEAAAKASSGQLAAEVLFLDGMKLMKEGRCAEALAKFRDSQELDPASGTLLNLAYCQLTLDRIASAWLTYRQALALAQTSQKAQHAQIAREQAAKLEPELPRLVIRSADAGARELIIELDGAPLTPAVWSLPVPVDPGEHRISAKLEDGSVWQTKLHIARAERSVVEVPLAVARAETPRSPAAPPQGTAISPLRTPEAPPLTRDTYPKAVSATTVAREPKPILPPPIADSPHGPLWAFGIAMVGAGAFTAGASLFISARTSYDSARSHCGPNNACPDPYYDAEKDAIGRMRLSLVLAGAGVAASGVGAWLYWMPPRKTARTSARIGAFICASTAGIGGEW